MAGQILKQYCKTVITSLSQTVVIDQVEQIHLPSKESSGLVKGLEASDTQLEDQCHSFPQQQAVRLANGFQWQNDQDYYLHCKTVNQHGSSQIVVKQPSYNNFECSKLSVFSSVASLMRKAAREDKPFFINCFSINYQTVELTHCSRSTKRLACDLKPDKQASTLDVRTIGHFIILVGRFPSVTRGKKLYV